MTILLATLAAIYAVSLCFVAALFARTLWHDRSTPSTPVEAPTPEQSATPLPVTELHPAPKSA